MNYRRIREGSRGISCDSLDEHDSSDGEWVTSA